MDAWCPATRLLPVNVEAGTRAYAMVWTSGRLAASLARLVLAIPEDLEADAREPATGDAVDEAIVTAARVAKPTPPSTSPRALVILSSNRRSLGGDRTARGAPDC
jgi:hypothetical protein